MGRISEGKSPTIAQLRPWHRSMARMMVTRPVRPGDLAVIFGMSPSQISIIINSPLFKMELSRLEAMADMEAVNVRAELELRNGMAIEAIDRGLMQDDPHKAAQVGFDVLALTGHGKEEKHKHLHVHAHAIKNLSDKELMDDVMDVIAEEDD